jgi:hypothetical protein
MKKFVGKTTAGQMLVSGSKKQGPKRIGATKPPNGVKKSWSAHSGSTVPPARIVGKKAKKKQMRAAAYAIIAEDVKPKGKGKKGQWEQSKRSDHGKGPRAHGNHLGVLPKNDYGYRGFAH